MATSFRPALLSRQLLAQRTPMALRAFHASPTRAILPPLPQVIKGTRTLHSSTVHPLYQH
jgi:succinate dehydrogenase (ubiquinone) membrane anchor subunit